jgi:hypothetical protein
MRYLLRLLGHGPSEILELFIGVQSLVTGLWIVFGTYNPTPSLIAWRSLNLPITSWGAIMIVAGSGRVVSLACKHRPGRWFFALLCVFTWVFIATANLLASTLPATAPLPICIMGGSMWTLLRLSPPYQEGDLPPWVLQAIHRHHPNLPPVS